MQKPVNDDTFPLHMIAHDNWTGGEQWGQAYQTVNAKQVVKHSMTTVYLQVETRIANQSI
jgi:hypothetical protein